MLYKFLSENDMSLNEVVKNKFNGQLSNFNIYFTHYFPQNTQQQNCIKDPFSADLSTKFVIYWTRIVGRYHVRFHNKDHVRIIVINLILDIYEIKLPRVGKQYLSLDECYTCCNFILIWDRIFWFGYNQSKISTKSEMRIAIFK